MKANSIMVNQEERPYIELYWPHLKALAESNWSDTDSLQGILSELKYRTSSGALDLRKKVTERLVDLSRNSFLWPSTAIRPSSEALNCDNFWYEDGLLSFLGYRVGQSGASTPARLTILDYVYNERIPNVNSREYMQDWGSPKSGIRLSKMAESIASFTKNAKRKNQVSLSKAISEWEHDLLYLKVKYYDGVYDFSWPNITVS